MAPKDTEAETAPKSFVIRSGELTKAASRLTLDLRRVMEPNTASNLKVRAFVQSCALLMIFD